MNLIFSFVMLGVLVGVVWANPLGPVQGLPRKQAAHNGNNSPMNLPALDKNAVRKPIHRVRKREVSKADVHGLFFTNNDVEEWADMFAELQAPQHHGLPKKVPITPKTLRLSEKISKLIEN